MDTLKIDKKITAPGFVGAFPYDELPQKSKSDTFSLVINTESSKEQGDHWLVLLYKKPYFYFLDSYGRSMHDGTFSSQFTRTIKSYVGNARYKFNRKMLQQLTSNVCGDYCVYFIMEMSKKSLENVLSIFGDDLAKNDNYVKNYVNSLPIYISRCLKRFCHFQKWSTLLCTISVRFSTTVAQKQFASTVLETKHDR